MNPRQRRGVALLIVAVLGSIGVFAAVSSYVADVRSQVEPFATVLALADDVAALQPVTEDLVEEQDVPRRWVPQSALRSRSELGDLVASADLPAGSLLQEGMLVGPPDLRAPQRELAILVDAETGVAGKIGPDSIVDIYATFAGDDDAPPRSEIVIAGARIIDVGTVTEMEGEDFSQERVVPVTFALTVEESLILAYVESFAVRVRLGLRAPDDDDELGPDQRRFTVVGGGDPR